MHIEIRDERLTVSGDVVHINLFVCEYDPKRHRCTKHYVLNPFRLTFHAAPPSNVAGVNIRVTASDIRISISPVPFELLSKAAKMLEELTTVAYSAKRRTNLWSVVDYSDLWTPHQFTGLNYWFLRVDETTVAKELDAKMKLAEQQQVEPLNVVERVEVCSLDVPSISVVIETGFGFYTHPMLSLTTSLNAKIEDWSTDVCMHITSFYSHSLST